MPLSEPNRTASGPLSDGLEDLQNFKSSRLAGEQSEMLADGLSCVFVYNGYKSKTGKHCSRKKAKAVGHSPEVCWSRNKVLVCYCRSEEPVHITNMDISTGHLILSYLEEHLKNKDKLDEDWQALSSYRPDLCDTLVAQLLEHQHKNRTVAALPYDHARVQLQSEAGDSPSEYINASPLHDHDPKSPVYLATQGPLMETASDFWQMVWEQGSVVIVNLTKLVEESQTVCHRYWPENGSEVYGVFEVHLVSEHIWCEDYLVRSFYLKNLRTSETRTVTQFHFLSWREGAVPISPKSLLEFRRKVNKSYRGRSCPIVVHCSDGSGRSGTYCLLDMVLNRINKGVKEIDIAATLEHLRDQRMGLVATKSQYEFVLMCVAEEVQAIIRALPQQ